MNMKDVISFIIKAQAGDKKAREVLIEENLGLVHHIVKRYIGRGYELEDLFQIGSIGLMKAIDKFDISYEVCFSTYAVPMIAGEIKRFLRDDGMIKMSRSLKENAYKIKRTKEKLAHELLRDATIDEISKECGLSVEEIVMALESDYEVESIYKTVYQGDGNEIYLVDKLPDKKDENEHILNKMTITQLLNTLEEKERQLITLRYYKDKTQVEVAEILGISQVQVSRLEKKILVRMRQSLIEN